MGSYCTSTLPRALLLLDHYTVQLWLKSHIGQLGHQRLDLHKPEMRTCHHTQTTHVRSSLQCLGNNRKDDRVFSIIAISSLLCHSFLYIIASMLLLFHVPSRPTTRFSRHVTTCIKQSSSPPYPISFTASCTRSSHLLHSGRSSLGEVLPFSLSCICSLVLLCGENERVVPCYWGITR